MTPSVLVLVLAAATTAAASRPSALPLVGNCNVQTAQLAPAAHQPAAWLGMYCNNHNVASFAYNWTWIGLDACLANRAGHLHGRRNGHFGATCTRCAVHVEAARSAGHTLALQCACLDARGRGVSTVVDLNTVLVNVDGALGCYGHLGNKTLVGPLPKS